MSSARSRFLDKQQDRLKGGLSLLLLYGIYDKCGCNALSFFTAGVALRVRYVTGDASRRSGALKVQPAC